MKRIVVYTGSFNPATLAHFNVMERAMDVIKADEGIFLPTCDAHIKNKMINSMERLALSSDIRCEMLNTFCRQKGNVNVCDYEIKIKNSGNTLKSLTYIKESNPDSEVYYIMGADKLSNIPHWKNVDTLLENFNFIVFNRGDIDARKVIKTSELFSRYNNKFTVLDELNGLNEVSSSKIREMFLNNNKDYRKYLSKEVADILEEIDLKDYPEVTDYDYINSKLKSGTHGVIAAGRKVYLLNKDLFKNELKDIPEIIETNDVEKEKVRLKYPTKLTFEDEKEYVDICKEYEDPIIICECSQYRPGGKYDQGGSYTLEELLCKVTNISQALYCHGDNKLKCVRESEINMDNMYPLIKSKYVKEVTFIRHDENKDYRLLDNFNVKCDVMLTPCLNMTKNDKNNDCEILNGTHLSNIAYDILYANLYRSFYVAYVLGKKSVIINDFGHGFHIELEDAAYIISMLLIKFDGAFKNVVIKCKMKGKVKRNFVDRILDAYL